MEGEKRNPQRKVNLRQRQCMPPCRDNRIIQILNQKSGVFERTKQGQINENPYPKRHLSRLTIRRTLNPFPDKEIDRDRRQDDEGGPPLTQRIKKNARRKQDIVLPSSRRAVISRQDDRQQQEQET